MLLRVPAIMVMGDCGGHLGSIPEIKLHLSAAAAASISTNKELVCGTDQTQVCLVVCIPLLWKVNAQALPKAFQHHDVQTKPGYVLLQSMSSTQMPVRWVLHLATHAPQNMAVAFAPRGGASALRDHQLGRKGHES